MNAVVFRRRSPADPRGSSRMRRLCLLTTLGSLGLAGSLAGQLPPEADVVPAGFEVKRRTDLSSSQSIEATRPNANVPAPHRDLGIGLSITWTMLPTAQAFVDMTLNMPEDPASEVMGVKNEPCGREAHEGGVLTCRKMTTPAMGGGAGPALVSYTVTWMGAGPTGLLAVGVGNLVGDPGMATTWIDAVIPKIRG